MLYYCTMTTVGSVLGCLALFYVGYRGGTVLLKKKYAARHLKTIVSWHQRFQFLTIMIPAILPPPTPFKIFVISAGVLKMNPKKFILSVALGRSIRYFLEGYLAVQYGEKVLNHQKENYLNFSWIILILAIVALLTFLLYRKYYSLRQNPNSQNFRQYRLMFERHTIPELISNWVDYSTRQLITQLFLMGQISSCIFLDSF